MTSRFFSNIADCCTTIPYLRNSSDLWKYCGPHEFSRLLVWWPHSEGPQWGSRLELQNSLDVQLLEVGSVTNRQENSWRCVNTLHFATHTSDIDTTTIARSSTGGTSQRRFFRSVRLLHVSSAETTNCVEERRVSKDCGTTVGLAGRPFE